MKIFSNFSYTIVILIIILVVFFVSIAWWYELNKTSTLEEIVLANPGVTNKKCISSSECKDVCVDNDCLVPSCTKIMGNESGKCSCLDICGE